MYIKLARLDVVQVIGLMKDEQYFFVLAFMKIKLENQLTIHLLKLFIWMFSQKFFTFQNFPFGIIMQKWKDKKI
jgi:hypothetical protein